MIKMMFYDWFLIYFYQDYVMDIFFLVVIEYDCGMEYVGENLIVNIFFYYFVDVFWYYVQFDNVVGYCVCIDCFEEIVVVGMLGEFNLFVFF